MSPLRHGPRTRPRPALCAPAALATGALLALACAGGTAPGPDPAHARPEVLSAREIAALAPVTGGVVYVPVYSHVHHQSGQAVVNLTATASVRNTDRGNPIVLTAVDYYDSDGALVERYVEAPLRLPALASTQFIVAQTDTRGGAGANFLIEWLAESRVSEPVIEAVMIGTSGQQGISFTSPGRVIERHGE